MMYRFPVRGSIILADDGLLRGGKSAGLLFMVWGLVFGGGPLYWIFGPGGQRHNASTALFVMAMLGLAGIVAGLLLLLWRKQVRLDADKGYVEEISGFFGQTRIDRTPVKRFDCVTMFSKVEVDQEGIEATYYELNLCGPDCPVISLGRYFRFHTDAAKAGLCAASACGVAFEEYDKAARMVRLAPERVARLVPPAAVSREIPWWRRPSVIALVAANLVPIAGVLYADWEILPLMLLFWLENLVIGLFTIARMLLAQGHAGRQGAGQAVIALGNLVLTAFFVFHYGGFALGHGIFLVALFGDKSTSVGDAFGPAGLANLVKEIVVQYGLAWALLALVVSHGVSFYTNYLRPRRFEDTVAIKLMWAPYKRVVILHVVILLGAFAVRATHATILPLLLLIALKIIVDLGAHLREHRRPQVTMRDYRAMADMPDEKRKDALFSNVTTPDTRVRCAECGHLVPKESRLCNYCGCKRIPQS
jgi:hypothetical protein